MLIKNIFFLKFKNYSKRFIWKKKIKKFYSKKLLKNFYKILFKKFKNKKKYLKNCIVKKKIPAEKVEFWLHYLPKSETSTKLKKKN